MPETVANKKSASARGGGSHGISPVNQPPPPPPQRPPTPPPVAQAPLSPEKFVQPTQPLNPTRKLPPKRTIRQSTPTKQQSGQISPDATRLSVRPPPPHEAPWAYARLKGETDQQFRERLHIPADVPLDKGRQGWMMTPPPKRDPSAEPFVDPWAGECPPFARCAPRDPHPMPRPKPRPFGKLPRKKKPFQAGKKPRRPFKMGVPRKERIRLLKEQAAKEQWERDNPKPWGGGENFPRPPPDWDPSSFPRKPTNPRHNPIRPRKPRERRPFGIL